MPLGVRCRLQHQTVRGAEAAGLVRAGYVGAVERTRGGSATSYGLSHYLVIGVPQQFGISHVDDGSHTISYFALPADGETVTIGDSGDSWQCQSRQ